MTIRSYYTPEKNTETNPRIQEIPGFLVILKTYQGFWGLDTLTYINYPPGWVQEMPWIHSAFFGSSFSAWGTNKITVGMPGDVDIMSLSSPPAKDLIHIYYHPADVKRSQNFRTKFWTDQSPGHSEKLEVLLRDCSVIVLWYSSVFMGCDYRFTRLNRMANRWKNSTVKQALQISAENIDIGTSQSDFFVSQAPGFDAH